MSDVNSPEVKRAAQEAEMKKSAFDTRTWLGKLERDGVKNGDETAEAWIAISKHELGNLLSPKHAEDVKKNPAGAAFLLGEVTGRALDGDQEAIKFQKQMREQLFPKERGFRSGEEVRATELGVIGEFTGEMLKLATLMDNNRIDEVAALTEDLSRRLSLETSDSMLEVFEGEENKGRDMTGERERIVALERLRNRLDLLRERLGREAQVREDKRRAVVEVAKEATKDPALDEVVAWTKMFSRNEDADVNNSRHRGAFLDGLRAAFGQEYEQGLQSILKTMEAGRPQAMLERLRKSPDGKIDEDLLNNDLAQKAYNALPKETRAAFEQARAGERERVSAAQIAKGGMAIPAVLESVYVLREVYASYRKASAAK